MIHPSQALDFIARLPVEAFWGVGAVTAKKMHSMGIYNGAVLRSYSKGGLISAFGKMGAVYYDFARGIDDRPVVVDRERKSVGCERTLEEDLTRRSLLSVHLYQLVLELVERLRRGKFEGNVLTLKVKFSDFTQITRSRTVAQPLTSKTRILPVAELIDRVELRAYSLGVCLTAVNVCAAESHLASGIAESLNHSVGIGNRHHYTAARKFKLHDPLTVSGWRQTVGSASARLCGGIFFEFLFQIIVSHRVAVIRSHRSPRHVRRR